MAINTTYQAIADINLWLKVQSNDALNMADVPEIIPGRWLQFKEKWNYMRRDAEKRAMSQNDPDFVREQISDFTNFIETQKTISTSLNPFSDKNIFYRYYEVFNILPIDTIPTNNEERQIIDDAIRKVRAYSKQHFMTIKSIIKKDRDEKADTTGASDVDYNKTYNRSSVATQTTVSINDLKYMQTLQDVINAVDFILANITSLSTVSIDPFTLLKQNANNPDIPLETYSFGNLVKMNYGDDLAKLAAKYLNNADKWIEIAVANGLRPPYIDEIGSKIFLKSNANGNFINIDSTDVDGNLNIEKLYINQAVILQSTVEISPEQRTIVNIHQVPISGDIVIELDGTDNLNRYSIVDNAHIRIYKKNTIHSGYYILIPSHEEGNTEMNKEVPWFLQTSSSDEVQSKIDLALSPDSDIMFTSNSDIQLSYGLDNAIQAIGLKFSTELGEIPRHPEYGFIAIQGSKNVDIESIKNAIISSINFQIENDSRYDRVEQLSVDYVNIGDPRFSGVMFICRISVRLAGSGVVVPISFTANMN